MAKSSNQKLKLLYLIKLFTEKTDEAHYVTMPEIISYLEGHDIKAERKSIYDDVELLRTYGFDIVLVKEGKYFCYYLASRQFELAELKLLVDVVQSSKFITEKKSTELIGKLESLASRYQAGELQRYVYVKSRVKTMNENIYYNVDAINDAINKNVQINFEYYEWTLKKQLRKKSNGDKTGISPWALIWDDENYYMVAFDQKDGVMKHYRVDKIRKITLTDVPRLGREEFGNDNPALISKKLFGMFGGEKVNVAMEFTNNMIGVVMDRFGKDVFIVPKDDEHFTIHVDVEVSNMFIGWVIGLGEGVKVTGPEAVVERIKAAGERILQQYKE